MSIEGLGVDLIEVGRIEKALERWGDLFEKRILTPKERCVQGLQTHRTAFIAGRFAAKEAVFKAVGFNPGWHAVEVLPTSSGRPVVKLASTFVSVSGRRIGQVLVSISHSKTLAVAQAIALGEHTTR